MTAAPVAVTSGRQDLAARILAGGAMVNGRRIGSADCLLELLRDRLLNAGVRSGDVVVLCGLQGRDLVVATVAAWLLDAVPMPIPQNLAMPPLPVAREACRVASDLTVVPGVRTGQIAGLATTAVLHTTSGSTNSPKVAKRGAASVLLDAEGYRTGLSLRADECVAIPIPLTHSFGWGVAFSALLSGCELDVTPLVRTEPLARKIDSGVVSVLALTAPLARLLTTTRRQGGESLRVAMVGAGQVSDDLNHAFHTRFGRQLLRGYGSSETGGTFLGERGIGTPVPGVSIIAPPRGASGELVLRIAAPVEGLLDGGGEPTSEWSTGDVVRRDADGVVHFVERLRGQIRLNGRFIDADAVSSALKSVPGVRELYLLVLPRSQTPEIEDFFAVVEGTDVTGQAVADGLSGLAALAPVPSVVLCGQMPRNAVGKPDRDAVIDLVRTGGSGERH